MDILRQPHIRRLILILLLTATGLVLTGCIGAGLLPQFTYQGVLTDGSGNPLNGEVTITYRIYRDPDEDTVLYSETETVTVTDGRFDSVIGPDTSPAWA